MPPKGMKCYPSQAEEQHDYPHISVIRILQLTEVWNQADDAPSKDKKKFRDELLWQEYARHWYAALGEKTKNPLKRKRLNTQSGNGWDRTLPCINIAVEELETHGWLPNQSRMWLSSDWSVRKTPRLERRRKPFFPTPH